jgi:hypothetical protein
MVVKLYYKEVPNLAERSRLLQGDSSPLSIAHQEASHVGILLCDSTTKTLLAQDLE